METFEVFFVEAPVECWLEEANLPTAWLSLDEDDNDPPRFLTYLIAALQTVWPEEGAGALLTGSHTLLAPLINAEDLAKRAPPAPVSSPSSLFPPPA